MGDFFEDLGKRITETAEAVSKKTEEVVETQKMKNQIRLLEKANQRDFRDLGKMVYDKFKDGEIMDTKFIELCESVVKREQEIKDTLKEMAERKGKDICTNCNQHLEPEMAYCPKCGTKVEEDIFEEEEIFEAEEAETTDEADVTETETADDAEEADVSETDAESEEE